MKNILKKTDDKIPPVTTINAATKEETRERNETPKRYKTTTEKVTDAYQTAQEEIRKLFSEIISELNEIKESQAGIAQEI